MEIRLTYPDPSWDGAGPVAGGLQGRYCSVADPNPCDKDQERKGVKNDWIWKSWNYNYSTG